LGFSEVIRYFLFVVTVLLAVVSPGSVGAQDQYWPLGLPEDLPSLEIVDIPESGIEALIAAPRVELKNNSSIDLIYELLTGDVEKTRIEKLTHSYQGWIYFARQSLSETRTYRPRVVCSSYDDGKTWVGCQNMSWIDLQTKSMSKPIRFDGDLTDADIDKLLQYIDQHEFYSSTDGLVVISSKIYEIIKYPLAGNRVNVYVRTDMDGPTDVLYFDKKIDSTGLVVYSESEFKGSKP
jgi:hypothetical protein